MQAPQIRFERTASCVSNRRSYRTELPGEICSQGLLQTTRTAGLVGADFSKSTCNLQLRKLTRYPIALRSLAENSGLVREASPLGVTTGCQPHLFSKQRLLPDRIAFHEMDKREKTYPKGRVGVEPTVLKNSGFTDLYLRR